ncbi:MAG: hypothetical protein C6P35_03295 [Cohnella sp.]|uniref:hypothetical protein n=1 Tax=Cohnella sp. TaxID=1883426 RepID=UPI000E39CAC2|nr:hypothetical protein [Cohnella sp.]REK68008.1 MAG: hypothetical protein C6P35_03295 [Cohnella sp.]
MAQQPMYPAIVNSPQTELAADINASATSIAVLNGAALPAAPNLATIGSDETAETILYTGKSGNTLTGVTRGFQGTAKAWTAGAKVARMFTAYDHDTFKANIEDIVAQGSTLTTTLQHGPNLIQTDQASPLAATVYGRTLVNLLGKQRMDSTDNLATDNLTIAVDNTAGNYETGNGSIKAAVTNNGNAFLSQKMPSLPSNKYFLIVIRVKNGTANGINVGISGGSGYLDAPTGYTYSNTSFGYAYRKFKTIAEITSSSNVRFGPYVASGVAGSYFWVDSMAIYEIPTSEYDRIGVDPDWTGDKLAEKFPYVDGIQHLSGAALRKVGENQIPPFTEWSLHANAQVVEPYKLRLNATAANQNSTVDIPMTPNQQISVRATLTANSNVNVFSLNSAGTSTYLGNLTLAGTSSKTFTTPADCVAVRLIYFSTASGTFEIENPMLVLGDASALPASFEPRNDDVVYIPTKLASSIDGSVRDSFDTRTGQVMRRWKTDIVLDETLSYIFTSNSSGFKRFKVIFSSLKAAGFVFGVKYNGYPLQNVGTNSSGDQIFAHGAGAGELHITAFNTDTGFGDDYTPSAAEIKAYFLGWRMNNGTFGQPYNGSGTKTWVPLNATDNSGAVTTVPTTPSSAITSGAYDYYRLSYQLATPVTEPVEGYEGSIGLHAGGNVVEMLEGVIVREKIIPRQHATNLNWYINEKGASSNVPDCPLQYRLDRPIAIYRNGVKDDGWVWQNDVNNQNGNQYALISNAKFDPTAEYFVTYIALDKYALTANATEAKVEYRTNIGGVVGDLVQRMADNETKDSVQDWALDYIEAKADNAAFDIAAIKSQYLGYGTTAGTGTAYTLTLSPAPTALVAGMRVTVKIHTANTGAATLNVNGLGAKSIKKANGNDVAAGNLKASGVYTLVYDGSAFTLQGEGGSGDAQPSDVLSGKKFTNDNGEQTGTMPNNGTLNFTPGASAQSIPAGYTSGGTVAAVSNLSAGNIKAGVTVGGVAGTFTSDADATAADILSGKTAYVNGNKVTGTMPNLTGIRNATGTARWPNGDLAVYPERGYQKGGAGDGEIRVTTAQLQAVEGGLVPQNIVSGASIFGVSGTAIVGKRWASGTSSAASGSTVSVSGLGFTPQTIILEFTTGGGAIARRSYRAGMNSTVNESVIQYGAGSYLGSSAGPFTINSGGFSCSVPGANSGAQVSWFAIE